MIAPSTPVAAPATGSGLSPERMELRQAAEAFEAIMLRQLMASARASGFGGNSPFSGEGLEEFEAMRDEQFADIASQSGAFGLAASIEQQLAAHLDRQGG